MIAKLHIRTANRKGITFLEKSYFTPPFKLANITEDKQAAGLQLMIMNSSPGILDGDDFEIKIEQDECSSLQLYTQSFQRLFNMKEGAKQVMEIHLQKKAEFIYLPYPAVPHENSIFAAKNKIYLSDGCRLLWGEILTCGRKLNGEVFKFSKYHNITEVYFNNKMIIKENLLVQPLLIDPLAIGQLEGFTHQASLIYISEKSGNDNLAESLHDYLSLEKNIVFGISSTEGNGTIIRIFGHSAEQMHHQVKTIAVLIEEQKIIQTKEVYAD
jgi:urease accessory protein